MQRPGMITGQKGVRYGLHVRQPKQAEQKQKPAGRLAAFSADSDSDEDVQAQVARQAARKVADTKVQEMYAAALAEDPSAFDYDGVYDSIQEQKAAPKAQDKVARQPKYIASLLDQAMLRKKEQEITNEKRLLKERQKEDHLYDNEEKFVTSAYRKKLEEDKKWQESQRLKELEEERNDVTKLGHMNNFFLSLSKNVALGGIATQPVRQAAAEVISDAGLASPMAEAAADNGRHEKQQRPRQFPPSTGTAAAAAEHEQDASQHLQQQQQRRRSASSADDTDKEQQLPQAAGAARTGKQRAGAAGHSSSGGDSRTEQPEQPQQQQQQPEQAALQSAVVGGKRKNDDSAVAAARERYLARKRQQQMGA